MLNGGRGRALLVVGTLLAGCRTATGGEPIGLEKIGTVAGPAEDGGFQGVTLLTALSSRGERIAITPWVTPRPPVLVIGPGGGVVDTLAVVGAGPGQAMDPEWAVRGIGDTIFLVDEGKIQVYAPGHRHVRTIPFAFGGVWGGVQLSNGTLVLLSSSVGEATVLQAISPVDGSERWTVASPPFTDDMVPGNLRVAVAPDGALWTVRALGALEFTRRSPTGEVEQVLRPSADWFPPYARKRDRSKNAAPNTYITGMWIDADGRAWVVAVAADPEWASAEGKVVTTEGTEVFEPARQDDVRDGIIAVFDLQDGRQIALWRRDEVFGTLIEPGVLTQSRYNDEGWGQLDLYRVVPKF